MKIFRHPELTADEEVLLNLPSKFATLFKLSMNAYFKSLRIGENCYTSEGHKLGRGGKYLPIFYKTAVENHDLDLEWRENWQQIVDSVAGNCAKIVSDAERHNRMLIELGNQFLSEMDALKAEGIAPNALIENYNKSHPELIKGYVFHKNLEAHNAPNFISFHNAHLTAGYEMNVITGKTAYTHMGELVNGYLPIFKRLDYEIGENHVQ